MHFLFSTNVCAAVLLLFLCLLLLLQAQVEKSNEQSWCFLVFQKQSTHARTHAYIDTVYDIHIQNTLCADSSHEAEVGVRVEGGSTAAGRAGRKPGGGGRASGIGQTVVGRGA